MQKLVDEGHSPTKALQIFLQNYNYSIHTTTLRIPAEEMFGREIMNNFSKMHPRNIIGISGAKFKENEPVWIRFKKGEKWLSAFIKTIVSNRTYEVFVKNRYVKMHEDQIRKMDVYIGPESEVNNCNLGEREISQEDGPNQITPLDVLIEGRPSRNRRAPERWGF